MIFSSAASDIPLLSMRGINKSFGATRALHGVAIDVPAGSVMALIGENGAGKSTLMKILSGSLASDSGSICIDGKPFRPAGPHQARSAGVAMIYQELNLAPDLSVEDNIMLGQEEHRWGLLRRSVQRQKVARVLDLLGHAELQPHTLVGKLSIGAQQLVEIARALVMQSRLIVFDEPTSSLAQHDVEHLFDVIRKLKQSKIGIVYISHFLEEIFTLCDRYTVLRDGESVGSGNLTEASEERIVSLMVGRNVEDLFPTVAHTPGEPILSLQNLSGERVPKDVNFVLRRGEILGIAGLVGAGRTELLRAIFGLDPVRRGTVRIAGSIAASSPHARIRSGMGFVSEDRKNEGLAQSRSIADNITYSRMNVYSRLGFLRLGQRRVEVDRWMKKMRIKAASSEQTVNSLSGGNQQKVALTRVLHQNADILLLDEPTRGIDVGTKSEIYHLLGKLASQGKAIIFVSSYLPELLAVCDRIGVMSRGRLGEIRPATEWTEEEVMTCAIKLDH